MDKNTKKVLSIIGIVIGIIALIAIILSYVLKNNENEISNNNPNSTSTNPEVKKEISILNDDNTFFSIQNTMNDFYNLLNTNPKKAYDILSNTYKSKYNVNQDNIFNIIIGDNLYDNFSYMPQKIYYNPDSDITYYFINGYVISYSIGVDGDNVKYEDNVNYLLIVNEKKYYTIMPIEKNIDIEKYAKAYDIEKVDINNGVYFNKTNISLKNKLILYISSFKEILVNDTKKAYDMLSSETKNKYSGYEDFSNNVSDIYNEISTSVFSYSKKDIGGKKEYRVVSNNQKETIIVENNIMDYQITY